MSLKQQALSFAIAGMVALGGYSMNAMAVTDIEPENAPVPTPETTMEKPVHRDPFLVPSLEDIPKTNRPESELTEPLGDLLPEEASTLETLPTPSLLDEPDDNTVAPPVNPDELLENALKKPSKFTSTGYLLKVIGILLILLSSFYIVARFFKNNQLGQETGTPISPFTKQFNHFQPPAHQSSVGIPQAAPEQLQSTMTLHHFKSLQPKLLSKTSIAQNKDVHVVQVGHRYFVVGVTPQQVNLISELSQEDIHHNPNIAQSVSALQQQKATVTGRQAPAQQVENVYKKYLQQPASKYGQPPVGQEITQLQDYDDHFETPYN